MKNNLIISIKAIVCFGLLCSAIYPLFIWGIGLAFFHHTAQGSLVRSKEGVIVGSELIAQNFSQGRYFHSRPSSAGKKGYDATQSSASNLGPTSSELMRNVEDRVKAYRQINNMQASQEVPSDAVLGSGSGLDPHISIENALRQIDRIGATRHVSQETLLQLVNANIERPFLYIFGENCVNVLKLNMLLDQIKP